MATNESIPVHTGDHVADGVGPPPARSMTPAQQRITPAQRMEALRELNKGRSGLRFLSEWAKILVVSVMLFGLYLLVLIAVPMPSGLWLFTAILLVHNSFGAMQDVAIDSLAVNTLDENERGLATDAHAQS